MIQRFLLVFFISCVITRFAQAQTDLSYYINQATNSSVEIYQNKKLVAADYYEIERLKAENLGPKVSLNADYLFAPYFNNQGNLVDVNPSARAIGYDPAITNGGLYAAVISLNQPLFNKSVFNTNSRQVLLQDQSYNYNSLRVKHDLIRQVTDLYIVAYQDQQQIENEKEVVNLLAEQLAITEQLVKSGTLAQTDYLLLSIEQKSRQSNLLNYQTIFTNDRIALDTLAGIINTADTLVLEEPSISLQQAQDSSSRFLRQFQIDSLRLENQQSVANLIYKPQVGVVADAGLNAVALDGMARHIGFSVGLGFRWLIFDGNQKRYRQQVKDIQEESISYRKQRLVNTKQEMLQQISTAINNLDQRIGLLQTQVTDYRTVIREYKKLLATGQFSVANMVNTLKAFMSLQNDLTIAKSDRLRLINNYNYWNW